MTDESVNTATPDTGYVEKEMQFTIIGDFIDDSDVELKIDAIPSLKKESCDEEDPSEQKWVFGEVKPYDLGNSPVVICSPITPCIEKANVNTFVLSIPEGIDYFHVLAYSYKVKMRSKIEYNVWDEYGAQKIYIDKVYLHDEIKNGVTLSISNIEYPSNLYIIIKTFGHTFYSKKKKYCYDYACGTLGVVYKPCDDCGNTDDPICENEYSLGEWYCDEPPCLFKACSGCFPLYAKRPSLELTPSKCCYEKFAQDGASNGYTCPGSGCDALICKDFTTNQDHHTECDDIYTCSSCVNSMSATIDICGSNESYEFDEDGNILPNFNNNINNSGEANPVECPENYSYFYDTGTLTRYTPCKVYDLMKVFPTIWLMPNKNISGREFIDYPELITHMTSIDTSSMSKLIIFSYILSENCKFDNIVYIYDTLNKTNQIKILDKYNSINHVTCVIENKDTGRFILFGSFNSLSFYLSNDYCNTFTFKSINSANVNGYRITSAIEDNGDIIVMAFSDIPSGGEFTCTYANIKIFKTIDGSLDNWKEITIKNQPTTFVESINKCGDYYILYSNNSTNSNIWKSLDLKNWELLNPETFSDGEYSVLVYEDILLIHVRIPYDIYEITYDINNNTVLKQKRLETNYLLKSWKFSTRHMKYFKVDDVIYIVTIEGTIFKFNNKEDLKNLEKTESDEYRISIILEDTINGLTQQNVHKISSLAFHKDRIYYGISNKCFRNFTLCMDDPSIENSYGNVRAYVLPTFKSVKQYDKIYDLFRLGSDLENEIVPNGYLSYYYADYSNGGVISSELETKLMNLGINPGGYRSYGILVTNEIEKDFSLFQYVILTDFINCLIIGKLVLTSGVDRVYKSHFDYCWFESFVYSPGVPLNTNVLFTPVFKNTGNFINFLWLSNLKVNEEKIKSDGVISLKYNATLDFYTTFYNTIFKANVFIDEKTNSSTYITYNYSKSSGQIPEYKFPNHIIRNYSGVNEFNEERESGYHNYTLSTQHEKFQYYGNKYVFSTMTENIYKLKNYNNYYIIYGLYERNILLNKDDLYLYFGNIYEAYGMIPSGYLVKSNIKFNSVSEIDEVYKSFEQLGGSYFSHLNGTIYLKIKTSTINDDYLIVLDNQGTVISRTHSSYTAKIYKFNKQLNSKLYFISYPKNKDDILSTILIKENNYTKLIKDKNTILSYFSVELIPFDFYYNIVDNMAYPIGYPGIEFESKKNKYTFDGIFFPINNPADFNININIFIDAIKYFGTTKNNYYVFIEKTNLKTLSISGTGKVITSVPLFEYDFLFKPIYVVGYSNNFVVYKTHYLDKGVEINNAVVKTAIGKIISSNAVHIKNSKEFLSYASLTSSYFDITIYNIDGGESFTSTQMTELTNYFFIDVFKLKENYVFVFKNDNTLIIKISPDGVVYTTTLTMSDVDYVKCYDDYAPSSEYNMFLHVKYKNGSIKTFLTYDGITFTDINIQTLNRIYFYNGYTYFYNEVEGLNHTTFSFEVFRGSGYASSNNLMSYVLFGPKRNNKLINDCSSCDSFRPKKLSQVLSHFMFGNTLHFLFPEGIYKIKLDDF